MPHLPGLFCPACAQESLVVLSQVDPFIRSVEELVLCCNNAACKHPTAAALILSDRQTDHVVTFTDTGFTIRHPLIERLDDALMDCDLHRVCKRMSGPPYAAGRYHARRQADTTEGVDSWIFDWIAEPVDGAGS